MQRWKDLTDGAARRHGIVTYGELVAAGRSDRQIRRWTGDAHLVDLGYGVFRIGGAPATFEAEVLAAVLSYPDESWASHHTLSRLVDLRVQGADTRIELTRPTGLSAERAGVLVHRSTRVPEHHRTVINGIPCLTVSRTLFDLARTTGPVRLLRAVDRGLMLGLCTEASLWRVLIDLGGRGRPGTRRMREVLQQLDSRHVPPESELEAVGMALLAGLDLEWQVELTDERGYIRRVDGLHRATGLIVELDGRQHQREPQRSLDRAGDDRLRRLGYRIERLGWHDVTRDGDTTRARVESLVLSAAG